MVSYIASINELGNMLKEPTHIQAHLVFAYTHANAKNQKSLNFANARQKQNKKLKDRNKTNVRTDF
jgi:hypothetical protein